MIRQPGRSSDRKRADRLLGRVPRGVPAIRPRAAAGLLASLALACAGCGDAPPAGAPEEGSDPSHAPLPLGAVSADARMEVHVSLLEDLEAPRHPSDGGGRVWLEEVLALAPDGRFGAAPRDEDGRPVLEAGQRARFRLIYEAGPEGVAVGGLVFLQISPFWEWDPPQTQWRDAAGYTEVSTSAPDIALEATAVDAELMAISIDGRALASGDRIAIVYGAGPAGARVDRFAESEARLWLAVDGDGDGTRRVLADSPSVGIRAGPAGWLLATATSTAEPGDEIRLVVAVVDGSGNAGANHGGADWQGEIAVRAPEALGLPDRLVLGSGDRARGVVTGRAAAEGVYRVRLEAETDRGPLTVESNPIVVRSGVRKVLWADLHGHSSLSDGTGTPQDYYDYARHVAALDVAALTDHDHWGMRFLDATPELWDRIRRAAERNYDPGRFVTLLGYEWTSWLQGHRHVLYFSNDGEVLSSVDPRFDTPDELWDALAGRPALTFAHHSAGGPVSTNWTYAPPPELEPVTEIVSVHGSSEALDSPQSIYSPVPGNFVRDVLDLGYRFGFIGSGDSHDGHPGLAWISASGGGGLAALYAQERTREAVLESLRRRATYATNGPRMVLDVRLAPPGEDGTQRLRWEISGTAPLEGMDFIRSGLKATVGGGDDDALDWSGERHIPALKPGEYVYLRVRQRDGGVAWSSPFYGPEPAVP